MLKGRSLKKVVCRLCVDCVLGSWFMKKLLGILVLGLLWCNIGFAEYPSRYEKSSQFWTTYGNGPKTTDQFIKKFLKSRELDPLEGIWMQTGYGIVGITKSGNNYVKYLINVQDGIWNGSIETTYFKTAAKKIYSAMVRIDFKKGDGHVHATSTATVMLENINFATVYIDRYAINKNHELIRQWPLDFYTYNKKFNPNLKEIDPKKKIEKGQLVSGSGFFINNKGYVVTNSHVIEGCKTDKKVSQDIISADFELVAEDKSLDLALLKTKFRNKDFLKLSKNEIGKLDKVIVAGYPLGKFLSDDLKFTEGIVSSLKGFQGASHEMQIDAAINTGNSGGPVVDEEGNLIGVAVATLSKELTEGINFAIKSSSVEMFLKSNAIKPIKSGYSFGNTDRAKLRDLLENSTVYISCKL